MTDSDLGADPDASRVVRAHDHAHPTSDDLRDHTTGPHHPGNGARGHSGELTPESLASLLGGSRGAIDATVPVLAFVVAYLLSNRSVGMAGLAALAAAVIVAGWRLRAGRKPGAVLLGVLGVCASALIALYTGRAQDFFLIQIFTNAASALAWALSIVLRWPLLGVVVGVLLGQKSRWRSDPALLRGYGRASWVWVGQYLVRLAIFLPLWAAGWVTALGVARAALTWPLIAACLALSWWVLRRALPPGHPGVRHPEARASRAAELGLNDVS